MKELVLLCGPPGSGKSTLAKEYIDKGYSYINQDTQGKAEHLNLFNMHLDSELSIVIDRMNFNKIQRNRYLIPAKENGYKTTIIVLHESFDTCLQRCKTRVDHPTIKNEETAVKAITGFFKSYERVEDTEADTVTRLWPEGYKEKAIWVDIDNTLSNTDHRNQYVSNSKKDWNKFFSEMHNDSVNEWCKELIEGMKSTCKILLCSARPMEYKVVTEKWLKDKQIPYDKLIMRFEGDYRKDALVKEIFLDFEIKTYYQLIFSVDDRKQVIDKIRSNNVIVLDCAGEKGNF